MCVFWPLRERDRSQSAACWHQARQEVTSSLEVAFLMLCPSGVNLPVFRSQSHCNYHMGVLHLLAKLAPAKLSQLFLCGTRQCSINIVFNTSKCLSFLASICQSIVIPILLTNLQKKSHLQLLCYISLNSMSSSLFLKVQFLNKAWALGEDVISFENSEVFLS